MLITKFFENQEIFVTGGSGFIGKALIEKLLRSCPGISKIFVLLRGKKGKDAQERLRDILKSPLFNRLREEQPKALRKVYAIHGDCAELGLGISAEDLERLMNVTIIYHSAASVRFDDALRDAIILNTRGTFELVKIAQTLKHLKVFLHVSTTYCNPDKPVVEEKVYPAYADWRTTIKLAETYNTEMLNVFNLKYGNFQPNTYTFTKSLAEQIINDYRGKLPMIILRPSIVVSSMHEPVPGWVDNFNGPIGMLVACGIGILRTNYADPDLVSDFVPVDIVVRAMVIACYKRGIAGFNPESEDPLDVVNCATADLSPIGMGKVIEIGKRIIKECPFEKTLWVPGGSMTRCPVWNFIRFVTLQIFMAILVDCALRFTNNKPFLCKLQRRIYTANLALHFFLTNSWVFKNGNFYELDRIVPKQEFDTFAFLQYSDVNYEEFFYKGIKGARQFLLNEPAEISQGAHTRMKIYMALHFMFQLIGGLLITRFVIRFLYSKYVLW